MNRTPFFLICVVFLLLLTAGCGGNSYTYPEPSAARSDGALVSDSGTVEVGSAGYETDFATITVPENRDRPVSRLIDLPVLRIHSVSKSPREPIFCLSGGPGLSNMGWDWKSTWYLLADHDIVIVGYRGADGSAVLNCPEVSEAFVGNGDLMSEESLERLGKAWCACANRLTSAGVDLDGYTMLETIEDNEAVRKALGYDRINLISASYGTRVAYLYGLRHGERINRSVMICVNPPGRFVWEPEVIDRQLKQYSDLWSKDSLMSLKSKDLYADIKSVLENMPRHWLWFSIDPGKVKVVTFSLLFQRKTAAMVFDTYVAAKEGDPSGLALMSLAYDYVFPSLGSWGDLASKAISADYDSTRDYAADGSPSQFPLGSPMNRLLWSTLRYGRWPMKMLPEEYRKLQPSDIETLLLSGSLDFSTPAEHATNDLLPYLSRGTQVILSECGHVGDVVYLNPENVRRMLTSFYQTGVVDTSLNTYKPMDFSVGWGFPELAKIGVATLAALATGLVVGIVLLAKNGF